MPAVAHRWGSWYYDHDRQPLVLSPAEAHHARVEAIRGLGGVLTSLAALRCNHPNRGAAYKPR